MNFPAILHDLNWGTLYVASEWLIRIAALFYVPQRRPPSAARAWLLLIFFLPWVGLVLYLLIGRAYMPRRRLAVQRQIVHLIRELAPRPPSFDTWVAGAVSPELLPALRLADRLSEFPIVGGNHFELLPDYDAALDRIIAEVEGAQRFVHMLFYIFENDDTGRKVAAALERAARRGVAVRVLMDAIGSRAGLKGLGPGLRAAGAEVVAIMPLRLWGPNAARFDLRNHRKIVVVDGASAFFGSQNVVSAHANRGMVNEEMLVRVSGSVVRHLHAVLLGDRYTEVGNLPPESRDLRAQVPDDARNGLAQVVPSGPGYNEGTAESVMIALMYGARTRVVLTSPYVIPSEPFLTAMCSTARRGVEVHLIVDRESNKPVVQKAQQSFYDTMLRAGVQIHRHSGSFLHAKHMSVDDDVALIGSSNLDIRSFALNAEVSVLICDRDVVADLRRVQEHYLRHTDLVTREERAAMGWRSRALENLARLTDSLLMSRARASLAALAGHRREVPRELERPAQRCAVDAHANALHAAVLIDEREPERLPLHIGAEQRLGLAAKRQRSTDSLELLREVELALPVPALVLHGPATVDLRRHEPEEGLAVADAQRLVGLPFAHVPQVRNDARSRLHPEDLRAQLLVDVGQQVKRDDRRPRKVLLEDVALDDRYAIGDACPLGVASRKRGEVAIVFDADRARAECLGRGDRYLAVARAEVVHDIVARRLRRLQHPRDHRVGRGQPHHVLARLTQARAVELVAVGQNVLRLEWRDGGQGDRHREEAEPQCARRHGM